jgi:hypothetical protein
MKDDLESIIRDLIRRKYEAREGSAEHRLIMRELSGLRFSREDAGPIMEDLDPLEWGSTDRLTDTAGPGQVLPIVKPGSGS